eukprot:gene35517-43059_t
MPTSPYLIGIRSLSRELRKKASSRRKKRNKPRKSVPDDDASLDCGDTLDTYSIYSSDSVNQSILSPRVKERKERVRKEYPNGDIYEGELAADGRLPHGKGTYTFSQDGESYDGQWNHGKFHGKGRYVYSNGDKYHGDWRDGYKHGYGVYVYAHGDVYEGDWQQDYKHGRGRFESTQGDVYEGDFVRDQREGFGRRIYNAEDERRDYEGSWRAGRQHGFGTMTYKSGTVYEGAWNAGRKLRGRQIFRDAGFEGDVYEGDWGECEGCGGELGRHTGEGLAHGQGVYRYAGGDVYVGGFACFRRCGRGVFTIYHGSDPSNDSAAAPERARDSTDELGHRDALTEAAVQELEGDWQSDEFLRGRVTYLCGDVYEGDWADARAARHGHGRMIYMSGDVCEGVWQDNVLLLQEKEPPVVSMRSVAEATVSAVLEACVQSAACRPCVLPQESVLNVRDGRDARLGCDSEDRASLDRDIC